MLASVGALEVYVLLAVSIGLVALAGAGRVWKRCGVNYGTGSSASSIRSSGIISMGHHRSLGATVSKGHEVGAQARRTSFHAIEAANVHHDTTPSLASPGLRGGSVAVNARHGADREAAWH